MFMNKLLSTPLRQTSSTAALPQSIALWSFVYKICPLVRKWSTVAINHEDAKLGGFLSSFHFTYFHGNVMVSHSGFNLHLGII